MASRLEVNSISTILKAPMAKKKRSFFIRGLVVKAAARESPLIIVMVPPLTSKSPLVVAVTLVLLSARSRWISRSSVSHAWRQTPDVDLSPCCRPHAAPFAEF
ncbi:hypothetical protein L484_002141 [Morus notabilis]|uniref:Uncharacterized protein n=1 Tax=Morus notabilis TaxID=981085 RepID=W9RZD1_9ROSA|nr:hypothetical protein L484_002141 [Morus notabilis]